MPYNDYVKYLKFLYLMYGDVSFGLRHKDVLFEKFEGKHFNWFYSDCINSGLMTYDSIHLHKLTKKFFDELEKEVSDVE